MAIANLPNLLFCAQLYRVEPQEAVMNTYCETFEEIHAASVAVGVPVSPHQLRRWRGLGLLPDVRQFGRGRLIGGSETRHPIGTAKQAIEICQLLKENEKLAGVGWKLWMRGFSVREDHWRVPLEAAQSTLRFWSKSIRDADVRDARRGGAETIYDLADLSILAGSPVNAAMMRLPPSLRSIAIRVGADILLGRFKADGASGKPFDPEEAEVVETVMGFTGAMPRILGESLNFGAVPITLEKLSVSINGLSRKHLSIQEPSVSDRQDFLNAQIIAIDLYRSVAWLFKGGFNLRTAERIIAKSSLETQAIMLLVWSRFLANKPEIESSFNIAEMANGATHLRQLAEQLQTAIAGLPKDHPLGKPSKFRRALSNPDVFIKFINSMN